MLRVLSSDLWREISRLSKLKGLKRAAVAYISSDTPLKFQAGDEIVVNASDEAVRAGQTSAAVLGAALSRGAVLFSNPNLHAKVLVLGGTAVVSSANLSKSSQDVLHELGIVSDDPETVSKAVQFIEQVALQSIKMDASFIRRILALPVDRGPHRKITKRPTKVRIRAGRTWMLGLCGDPVYPGDGDAVEAVNESVRSEAAPGESVDWFWWSGSRSRFCRLAKVGDRIISIYRPRRANKSTRTVRVYRHSVIRRIFRERGCSAITYHCVSRSDSEATRLSWSRFLILAGKTGLAAKLTIDSMREINADESTALHYLWSK